jgi:hypothetical protein
MQINQTKQNLKLITVMKNLKTTLLLLALGVTSILSSCKKDPEVDPRDAFVGTYAREGECGGGVGDLEDDLKIEKGTKDAKSLAISFVVFKELGEKTVNATINGSSFEVEPFEFETEDDDGNRVTVEIGGSGKLSGKTLELEITIDEDNTFCEFEGDKK